MGKPRTPLYGGSPCQGLATRPPRFSPSANIVPHLRWASRARRFTAAVPVRVWQRTARAFRLLRILYHTCGGQAAHAALRRRSLSGFGNAPPALFAFCEYCTTPAVGKPRTPLYGGGPCQGLATRPPHFSPSANIVAQRALSGTHRSLTNSYEFPSETTCW